MGTRMELQALLETLSDNVYFQPPPNDMMTYPCILYRKEFIAIQHAGNNPYKHKKRYQVTVIDPDPDSTIPDEVAKLPTCNYDRSYAADGLNHDVFTIHF
jgi:hypothetical protein